MAVVARRSSARGEVVLSRSDGGAIELRVNGVLVMSSAETSTEDLLATRVLERLDPPTPPLRGCLRRPLSIVVGGLGLGVTVAGFLRSGLVADVLVAEIEPGLVAWHLDGTVPPPRGDAAGSVLADPRVRVEVGDILDVVSTLDANSVDAVVLDVDNGPGFLVYEANGAVYEQPFLKRCADALTPTGVAAVWSADTSQSLLTAMRGVFDRVEDCSVPVVLGSRQTTYHLFIGQRLP
jgi:spermidine synthase